MCVFQIAFIILSSRAIRVGLRLARQVHSCWTINALSCLRAQHIRGSKLSKRKWEGSKDIYAREYKENMHIRTHTCGGPLLLSLLFLSKGFCLLWGWSSCINHNLTSRTSCRFVRVLKASIFSPKRAPSTVILLPKCARKSGLRGEHIQVYFWALEIFSS